MQQIYIHIAPHKTGTTSIQKSLIVNRDSLFHSGYFIPRAGSLFKKVAIS